MLLKNKNFGLAVITDSKNFLKIINTIAPEHLELCTNFNKEIIKGVKIQCYLLVKILQRLWEII